MNNSAIHKQSKAYLSMLKRFLVPAIVTCEKRNNEWHLKHKETQGVLPRTFQMFFYYSLVHLTTEAKPCLVTSCSYKYQVPRVQGFSRSPVSHTNLQFSSTKQPSLYLSLSLSHHCLLKLCKLINHIL